LISAEHCQEVADLVARARPEVEAVLSPRQSSPGCNDLLRIGTYYPPTIVCCRDPGHEVVQEETFGPVLVVQQASDFSQALELCNGVKQGLVAALFSGRRDIQQEFLLQARAGVLKINRATADVDLALPLGGWKASGIGPAEHGESDREFYTRTQAIYVS
jgi:acyl-CoA reductase-like NAD-dependent aldehyde dehydrogenase